MPERVTVHFRSEDDLPLYEALRRWAYEERMSMAEAGREVIRSFFAGASYEKENLPTDATRSDLPPAA